MLYAVRRAFGSLKRFLSSDGAMHGSFDEGFTIIEVVTASAILLTVVMSVMATVSFAATGSQQAQRRQGALNLATYRIEQAHALPFASVGTTVGAGVSGSPAGSLPAVETSGAYTINTTVRYAIDPSTNLPTYKIVSVTVSWTVPINGSVTVITNVMGSETLTGASVLLNCVDLDDASVDVPGVLVTLDPYTGVNQQQTTDSDGNVLFGSVATGTAVVTASKANYLADLKPLTGSVVNLGANKWMMSLQKASSATINVLLPDGNDIPGATVSITNTDTTHLTAATTTTKTADANGMVYFPNLWEITNAGHSYQVKIIVPNAVGSIYTTTFPMESGGLNKVFNIYPVDTSVTLTVLDQAAGWAVQGATVSYSIGGVTASKTLVTDANGQCTFFGIPAGTVTFTATKITTTTRTGSTTKTVVSGQNAFNIYTNLQ